MLHKMRNRVPSRSKGSLGSFGLLRPRTPASLAPAIAERGDRCMRIRALDHVKRFGAQDGGATMVEFALVSTPFLALVMASLQTAIVFTMGQALQTATVRSARLIETGQATGMTASSFNSNICGNLPAGFDCTKLYVDVQSAPSFSSISTSPITLTRDSSGSVTNAFSYSTGAPGSVVIVRALYDWPIFAGGLSKLLGGVSGYGIANQPDGGSLLVGTVVLRNEPFT